MIFLRASLALFVGSSPTSMSGNQHKVSSSWCLSSSSNADVTADAPPFEPIRDTCLEDFQRRSQEEEDEQNDEPKSPLSSFSTIRNGPSSSTIEPTPQPVVYRVCLSPGCVADGALKTYEQLLALAPPHVIIEPGSCHSLCGNGPVVDASTSGSVDPISASTNNVSNKRIRKVSGSKVLQILQEEGVLSELVTGYDLVLQGDQAFAAQQYQKCVELYRQAVDIAFRPAMDAQATREHLSRIAVMISSSNNSNKGAPASAPPASTTSRARGPTSTSGPINLPTSSLDWLVRARRNTATSLLQLGDLESALLEAQAACNLSKNTCWKSFGVVAECYKLKGNTKSEYETLKALFALSVDESTLDFSSKNGRRELQFRMQRLAKELKA